MLSEEQQAERRSAVEQLQVQGWDHCHKCMRSQSRFHFYYQEQFDENHASKLGITCIFCDSELSTYCEGVGLLGRPEGWKVPTKIEFAKSVDDLNKQFGVSLTVDNFKVGRGDYMNRPVKNSASQLLTVTQGKKTIGCLDAGLLHEKGTT